MPTLHDRILAGDPTAPAAVAQEYLCLAINLEENFPYVDPHIVHACLEDVILGYLKSPDKFDPNKGTLGGYLRMAAYGDIQNEYQKLSRYAKKINENVELEGFEAEQKVTRTQIRTKVMEILSDPTDLEVFERMADGKRDTGDFASLLGLNNLPPTDQRREVKKVKDRILKKLKRSLSLDELL